MSQSYYVNYRNRYDPKYRQRIIDTFSGDLKKLKESAILLKSPETIDGVTYDKLITIDYLGISPSILFDKGGNYSDKNVETSKAFYHFLERIPYLNQEGYKIRFRILMSYPYSDNALTRMRSENDKDRSSTAKDEQTYQRNFRLVKDIDEKNFFGSNFYKNQQDSLQKIQELIKTSSVDSEDGPSSIRVRFTPIGSSICMLMINDTFYFDPYLLSKQYKDKNSLQVGLPLTVVTKNDNLEEYLSLEDQFRYLWTLDITLYCEDATNFDRKNITGLDIILAPGEITFDSKERRLINAMKDDNKTTPNDDELALWRFKLHNLLRVSTQGISRPQEQESIFITCSWSEDKEGPNQFAINLKNWLEKDFKMDNGESCLKVRLVKARPGKSLSDDIYNNLNSASLACIIMARDYTYEGKGYCKPNIYHELGYLMKQLDGTKRFGILAEDGVVIPSNISDKVRIGDFNKNNFSKIYLKVLEWFDESNIFINKNYIRRAKEEHASRVR